MPNFMDTNSFTNSILYNNWKTSLESPLSNDWIFNAFAIGFRNSLVSIKNNETENEGKYINYRLDSTRKETFDSERHLLLLFNRNEIKQPVIHWMKEGMNSSLLEKNVVESRSLQRIEQLNKTVGCKCAYFNRMLNIDFMIESGKKCTSQEKKMVSEPSLSWINDFS